MTTLEARYSELENLAKLIAMSMDSFDSGKQDTFSQIMNNKQNDNSFTNVESPTPATTTPDVNCNSIVPRATAGKIRSSCQRRKRMKKNPVWQYFSVINNIAYCQTCQYSTKSVFSTNLKVHLKCHHPVDYQNVMNAAVIQQQSFAENEDKIEQKAAVVTDANASQTPSETGSPNPPPLQNDIFKPPILFTEITDALTTSNNFSERIQKRRRLRRHPVWQFFSDLDEKQIGCTMCDFKTVSGYTTNLKMHLRAHHKSEFVKVMELECQQRKEEGYVDSSPLAGKRKRRTAEDIEKMLDVYKGKIQQSTSTPSPVPTTSTDLDVLTALIALSSGDSALSAKLVALLGPPQPAQKPLLALDSLENFRTYMLDLCKMDRSNPMFKQLIKQARDFALGQVINEIGIDNIPFFLSNGFSLLMIAMDPSYSVPGDEDSLKKLADTAKNTYTV